MAPLVWHLLALLAAASPDERSALEKDPRGWVDILPGPKLAGWGRQTMGSTRGGKSAVYPEIEVWAVDRKTGILDCRGQLAPSGPEQDKGAHEMLRHQTELGDFVFHVEWRFVDPQRPGWNAGVFARVSADGKIWHQAQVGNAAGGNWFGDTIDESGGLARVQLKASEQRVKPVGQWNVYEVTARGDTLGLWVNGATVSEWKGLRVPRGYLGLEAERHHIEFRNLKLKRLGR